jgi:hypothetical protein
MVRTVTLEVELPDGLADLVERRRSELDVELSLPSGRRNLPTTESEVSGEIGETG